QAAEAGGESASPRRGRSRAWGTEPKKHTSPRSGRQMNRTKAARTRCKGTPASICRQLRRLVGLLPLTNVDQCSVELCHKNKNLRTCNEEDAKVAQGRSET